MKHAGLSPRSGASTRVFLLCAAASLSACSADEQMTDRSGGGLSGSGGSAASFAGTRAVAGTGAGLGGGSGFGNHDPNQPPVAGQGPVVGGGTDTCASATVHTSRSTPVILFVIDGSGSMCETFGGSTRWRALRDALLAPMTGLVHRLAYTVEFGMLMYDGTIDPLLALTAIGGSPNPVCAGNYLEQKATGECPQLIQVPNMLDNAAAIDAAFPMTELGGSTPTDRAMNTAVDQLIAMQPMAADVEIKPQYIMLATDGQPNDICVGGVGGDGSAQKAAVLAAVDRAAMRSIKTWVISLAGGDPGLQAHLDEVARHGDPMNPMAQTYTPATPEDLVNALAALVGGAIGCEVTLEGQVTVGQECRGRVLQNDVEIPCCQDGPSGTTCGGNPVATADGWRLSSPSTIELVGQTCTNFLSAKDVRLMAEFPCEIFLE